MIETAFRLGLLLLLAPLLVPGVRAGEVAAPRAAEAGQMQAAPVATMSLVVVDRSRIKFDDGDTVSVEFSAESGILDKNGRPFAGELRLLGYDTPETLHPEHGIFYDQPFGPEASAFAKKLIEEAMTIEVYTFGQPDQYGRLLAHLVLDGTPLAVRQIEAGLAYESVSFFGDNGFPEFARRITDEWSRSPIRRALDAGREPAFISPHIWRKLHMDSGLAIKRDLWNAMPPLEKAAAIAAARRRAETRSQER